MHRSRSRPMTTVMALSGMFFLNSARALPAEEPLELQPSLVVTASRSPQDAHDALGSVTLISAEDIRLSVAEDLVEILRLQPGIDIVRTGGPGAQTSVFMRGGNSNHVLVLIDGIRVASPHTGAYAWEQMPLNQVERIEIVRGPRASLYGSDAIGGVIQVFTKQAPARHLRVTAGSFGTGELEAGLGFGDQLSRLSLNAAYRHTGGYSSQNQNGFSFNPDNDGFETKNLGVNGSTEMDSGTLAYLLLASDNETEFDEGISNARQLAAALSWGSSIRPGWDYQLQAALTDDDLESDFVFFASEFRSSRLELGWQNQLSLEQGNLAFGLDHNDDSGESVGSYDESRSNTGVYVLWEQPLARTDLQASARFDENSEFGSEFTWQAAAALDVGASGRLTGLAGSAFRAPSLSEQFSPGFGGLFSGNPSLRPETSDTVELLYRHSLGASSSLSVSAYDTRIKQLIAFSGADFGAVNIDRARLRGVELEYARSTAQWTVNASVTLQDNEDRSTGGTLLRRPDGKASLSFSRTFAGGAWAGADWFVSGERLDVGHQRLPGYGVFSLRGGFAISMAVKIEMRLENLLDREYEPAAGFNSAGRAGFVSILWQP